VRVPTAAGLSLSAALLACSCGGGGASNGTTPAPALPVVPSPQPPARDVTGPWSGTESGSDGVGTVQFDLFQDGGVVTGDGSFTEDKLRDGLFAGVLSGSTLIFNFNYGQNCVRMVSGTLAAGATMLSGPFSRADSCSGSKSGQITLTTGRPDLVGTWSGPAPSVLGGGNWTWKVQQDGTTVTAAVTIATNNVHETDALSGSISWVAGRFTFAGTFPIARCSGVTATVSQDINAPPLSSTQMNDVLTLSNNSCLGPVVSAPFTLTKN
jgi:hypothetical protein